MVAVSYQIIVCPKCGELDGAHRISCDYDPYMELEQLRAENEELRREAKQ